MSVLARPLAQGLKIHFETEIKNIRKRDQKWLLTSSFTDAEKEFDLVVLAIPAPQATLILSENEDIRSKLENVKILPCLAANANFC